MIIGIGTDIIEPERLKEKISKENGFREQVFSSREITYCEAQANPYQHYAGRFAAKEALLKAMGIGLLDGFSLMEIEVINDEQGVPAMELSGVFRERYEKIGANKILLSLSHVKSLACATVILES